MVWCFRERLKELELLEQVFSRFDSFLALQGIHANRG